MVTVSWLQSDINALPKGFFLTHFVQLSPFSSGPDPKPIRSIEGFNSIQKAVYSVCNRNFQSTTDHGNLRADLNQVSALCNRENGAGICLFFFFFLMNCTRLFVWGCVGPSFHFRRLPSFHCRSTSPPFSRPCSKMLGRSLRLPSQSLLEDLVTDSPNLWRKWPHVLTSLAGLARFHGDRSARLGLPVVLPPVITSSLKCKELRHGPLICCSEHICGG